MRVGATSSTSTRRASRSTRAFGHLSRRARGRCRQGSGSRRSVERLHDRRVVFDSLTSAALGVASEPRFRELIHAMTKRFRAAGATFLMTSEVPEFLGATQLGSHGISPAADNLILMRYLEI